MQYGMLIDLSKCIGCSACTVACKVTNGLPKEILRSKLVYSEQGSYPEAARYITPVQCNQCSNPPCEKVCPTGATSINEFGVVTIDKEKCISCLKCVKACPYSARMVHRQKPKSYFDDKGKTASESLVFSEFKPGDIEKCDFCISRVREGKQPACVQTCVGGARVFGDLDDKNSEISKLIREGNCFQLKAEEGTQPNIYYKL